MLSLTLLDVEVSAPSVVVSEDARYLTGWLNVKSCMIVPEAIFF